MDNRFLDQAGIYAADVQVAYARNGALGVAETGNDQRQRGDKQDHVHGKGGACHGLPAQIGHQRVHVELHADKQ